LFAEFVRASLAAESRTEPEFRTLLAGHLGTESSELPVLAEDIPSWNYANLQLALEALFARNGRSPSCSRSSGT